MDFLHVENKTYLIFGVSNKKSVAYFIARTLVEHNAHVIFSVQSEEQLKRVKKLFDSCPVYCCNVENKNDIAELKNKIGNVKIHGIVHSVAFANYSNGFVPFHETQQEDFLQAVNISCFSLVNISNIFKENLHENASVITISISTTRMAAENYGYMAPIKAALDSTVCFLAKSFSDFSNVRFNAVCAGLLKTSASAGIPGYIDSYLFAEKATLRKKALKTQEVADTAVFLLSERASGINAQRIIVDAGMETNFFDKEIVNNAV
jgi:enoyl-[acyl-carrier protein] reductase I